MSLDRCVALLSVCCLLDRKTICIVSGTGDVGVLVVVGREGYIPRIQRSGIWRKRGGERVCAFTDMTVATGKEENGL